MTSQLELTESAHARRTDRATSHAAAASVTDLTEKQSGVLRAFKSYGQMTDEQMILCYSIFSNNGMTPKQSESGLRTRRSELVAKGKLIDSGERRLTKSNRKSIVWKLAAYTEQTNLQLSKDLV